MQGVTLRIRGLVQGVGFRPNVWRLARDSRLSGEVLNDGEGVLVHAWGEAAELERFCRRLRDEAPPLARIDAVERSPLAAPPSVDGFRIAESAEGTIATGIVPDAATCPDCLAEIRDPAQRRHGYAFANCTHCGPRLSIVAGIPYDRPRTSMAAFELCPACRAEYEDPADRRFHAQPIACPVCGPRLWLEDNAGAPIYADDVIGEAAARLRAGGILAIKGIGGFHLACDACKEAAVAELRRRKRRGDKPFAVMMPDLAATRAYVAVAPEAAAFLSGPEAPILLLPPRREGARLAAGIAPGQAELGVMLPYSPLHHLLLSAFGGPLVMTSGNRSDEPQCIDNGDARDRLRDLADAFLMHDRGIVNRVDDSVARFAAGAPRLMRRARGFAPGRMALPAGLEGAPPILAMGADLKTTFCLAADGAAMLSQHIGDLGDALTVADYRKALALYRDLFRFTPRAIAIDRHPDYASSRIGAEMAAAAGLPVTMIQHHHAHIAACMAEHGIDAAAGPVLGVALDGTGLGTDDTIWGGEFLLCTYRDFRRLGRIAPVALPGGDQAMRQPWRNAYAQLRQFADWQDVARTHADLPILRLLAGRNLAALDRMIERGVNAPGASSTGRLFDAVAALLDVAPETLSFEGEAAQKLEALALAAPTDARAYRYDLADDELAEISWAPLWQGILADLAAQTPAAVIARRFHETLADAVAALATTLAARHDAGAIALSGGVFHNRLLLESVLARLARGKARVLAHSALPSGDGGLALGQAAIAAARLAAI
jgi:hydrogenase maturation protein HypF